MSKSDTQEYKYKDYQDCECYQVQCTECNPPDPWPPEATKDENMAKCLKKSITNPKLR